MSVRARLRTLALSALVPALVGTALASPAEAQRITPDFWGMGAAEWSTSAPSVAVGAANFTTAGVYWHQIEGQPDALGRRTFNWSRLDRQVAGAEAEQARPMIVMGGTPARLSKSPNHPNARAFPPASNSSWQEYVRALATRYGTRLDYQIWPEPNIPGNWTSTGSDLGSPSVMAELTRIAAREIDAATGGQARVVAPAIAMRQSSQREWAYAYYKALGNGVVDVVALDPFPEKMGTPEAGVKLINTVRGQLRRIGITGVQYWTNEINYGVEGSNVGTSVAYKVDRQQAYVVRTYALHAAAGIGRVYWHLWNRDKGTAVHMTDTDGRVLPAAKAYTLVRSWLNGTSFNGCATRSGVTVCTARKSRREVRRIYWRQTGRSVVALPRTASKYQLGANSGRRAAGKVVKVRGGARVPVTSAPIMVTARR